MLYNEAANLKSAIHCGDIYFCKNKNAELGIAGWHFF